MKKFFGWNFRSGLLLGCAIAIGVAAAAVAYERYDTKTLKRTRNRDAVLCGVNPGLPGFALADEKGSWSGFDVDFCRAIAAAIFDDPGKVSFVPLDASERFTELQKRKVDVLSRNSTWNMAREANYGLHFAAVSYYDGQGFMVARSRNADSSLELDDAKVCVLSGTTTQLHLASYFGANHVKYQERRFPSQDAMLKAYDAGECDVLTADVSRLYAMRLQLQKPRRPCNPARRHLEGAARARGAPQRRPVAYDREVDPVRHGECGGAGGQLEKHRRGAPVEEAGGHAARRRRRRLRRGARAGQELGGAYHSPRGQLWRSL